MTFEAGCLLIGGTFAVAALIRSARSGAPPGVTPLPPLGDSIQPMNLLPARNVWRKKPETDL